METTVNKNGYLLLKNFVWITVSVISAIVLPQLFHAFGIATGLGDNVGQMFLPMYLPVLILAFKTNAIAGVIAGVLSPIISFALSGMPNTAMLPFIVLELACFGLFAGLLAKRNGNIFVKIAVVQLVSRLVRVAAVLVVGCVHGTVSAMVTGIVSVTLLGLPGYGLQLLAVPYFMCKK